MSIKKLFVLLTVCSALFLSPELSDAQNVKGILANTSSLKCTFSLMSVGTWGKEQPEAKVQAANLVLQFSAINTDEGTAELKAQAGKFDIIVRYAGG
jgi:hypothetical protein